MEPLLWHEHVWLPVEMDHHTLLMVFIDEVTAYRSKKMNYEVYWVTLST